MQFLVVLLLLDQSLWIPPSVTIESDSAVEWQSASIPCETHRPAKVDRTVPRPCDVEEWEHEILGVYPSDSLFRDQEGTVSISGNIDAGGNLVTCNVDRSGGHSILDQAACSRLSNHAKFLPALNSQGKIIVKRFETRVTFRLPDWPSDLGRDITQARPKDQEEWAKKSPRVFHRHLSAGT